MTRTGLAANLERWARQASTGAVIQYPILFTGAATLLEQQRRQCGV
ncbi:MAG TPA: hypothetical protein VMM93_06755 [Vicinamibacterales bacterium]|nr:hypothetical protein [Vicinamibacterales bacterium]